MDVLQIDDSNYRREEIETSLAGDFRRGFSIRLCFHPYLPLFPVVDGREPRSSLTPWCKISFILYTIFCVLYYVNQPRDLRCSKWV
jgi:hypothetical protein